MKDHLTFNSLAPGRSRCDSKIEIFNLVLLIGIFRSSHDNALWWMPQDLTDDKSTLVQVMAWCRQATSHYLSQCWLSSLLPYGATRPQWVEITLKRFGVFQYMLRVDMKRSLLNKDLQKQVEFIVEYKVTGINSFYPQYFFYILRSSIASGNGLVPSDTLRSRQKWLPVFQFIFFNQNYCIVFQVSLKFVNNGPIDDVSTLAQIMAWHWAGDKSLSETMVA